MPRPLLALLFGLALGAPVPAEPTKQILLIGKQPDHPHGTHRYLPTCRLLAHCLKQTPGVEATVSDGWPADWEAGQSVDAIVLYRSPFAKQMFEGPNSTEIKRLLDGGTGLVTLHWSTGVDKPDWDRLAPTMSRYQGGVWMSNSAQVRIGESALKLLDVAHPINRGSRIGRLRDEWYLNPKLEADAVPQWEIEFEGQPLTVAWSYERPDGGRSFATTLGHFWDNFTREPFRRAMVGAILWSAKVPVPEAGAPVDATVDLLALPPKQD